MLNVRLQKAATRAGVTLSTSSILPSWITGSGRPASAGPVGGDLFSMGGTSGMTGCHGTPGPGVSSGVGSQLSRELDRLHREHETVRRQLDSVQRELETSRTEAEAARAEAKRTQNDLVQARERLREVQEQSEAREEEMVSRS
ncbi:unnamed protein product [Protopolystoma xenopodis]|uniref:Uncharacterized protein n=1 Tax=Protopolystoma xenopodis TaxID=117903 RepID=A0A3S5BBH2_9PLAT|nr:unnamed protein product [Protopolystoma xenopodis]